MIADTNRKVPTRSRGSNKIIDSAVHLAAAAAAGFAAVVVGDDSATAAPVTTVVAVSGQAPPRGIGTFAEGLGVPVLHNSGQAAFVSNLREDGFLSGGGLFRGDGTPDSVETIVLTGDPLPDASGNFGPFSGAPSLQINSAGQIACHASLQNSLGANWGIYRFDGPDLITEIARHNEPEPGGNGQFSAVLLPAREISLNDSGQVALFAHLQNTSGGASDFQAMYRGDGGALAEVVRLDEPAPGYEGTFSFLESSGFALNQSGQLLFGGNVRLDDMQPFNGFFRGDGTSTVLLVRRNDSAPDGNGTLSGSFLSLSFNDRGETAFYDILLNTQNGIADNQGVFRTDGDNLVQIARKGDLLPDQNGRFLQFVFGVPLNNQGQVLFVSTISGASGGSDAGIFIGDGTNVTIVARLNDPAPGGGRFSSFDDEIYALNNAGQAVFYADIDLENGGSTNDTFGLFFYDPVMGVFAVAREGEPLEDIGPITLIQFAGGPVALADGKTGLNDRGQVAYRCHAGTEVAIALWSPSAPVQLSVEYDPGTAMLTVFWPDSASDGVLEENPNLAAPEAWMPSDAEAVLTDAEFRVTIPVSGERRFFRLRQGSVPP